MIVYNITNSPLHPLHGFLFYLLRDNAHINILQLTLITGLENYEQREPWTTTNEDNKTPFSLDQHEFPPIMKLLSMR